MGYSNVAGDLNVAATTTLSTLVVNGSAFHYGPITSTSNAYFANLVANTLTVTGNFTITATNTQASNSLSIVNQGSATALYVNQNETVAHVHNAFEVWDHTTLAMVVDPNGNVAIHTTSSPNFALTVVGGTSMDTLILSTPLAISSGGTGTATGATQNYVFAGPSVGSAGAPSFRALVNADLPSYVVVSNIYSNGTALYALNSSNLIGNVASANVALVVSQAAQPNITSVGILSGLTIQGLLIASNGSGISNINSSNLFGNVANANVALVVSQAAQPNITSVGTLTGLTISGLLIASNGSGISNVNGSNVSTVGTAQSVTVAAQSNITSVGTLTSLTVSGLLIASNGSGISNVNGSNVSTVGTAQSVTVAAQSNITSVGTLTSLTVSGLLIASNGSGISNVNGSNVSTVGTAQSVTAAAQSNITSVGTLTSLTVSGLLIASNGSGISNVNGSNVSTVGTAQSVTVAAQANITSVGTLTGLTVSGLLIASNGSGISNVNGSNVSTVGTAQSVTAAAQSNITSVGTLTSLTVSGILSAGLYLGNASGLSNITGSNVSTVGTAQSVTVAAQPNITSVGVLSNLAVGNSLTTTNVYLTGSLNLQGTANISNIVTQNVTAFGTSLVVTGVTVNGNVYVSNTSTAANGFLSTGTFGGVFPDGIVMDYVQGTVGNGRLSVGVNDALTFYTGGLGTTSTAYFDPNLRVGLGTVSPGSNLHVVGNVYASNALSTGSAYLTASLNVQGTSNLYVANIANIYTTNIVGFVGSQWTGQTGSTIYYINPVGIGTSTAGSNLTVSGNIYASNALSTGSAYLTGGVIASGTSNITTANITNIQTTNFIPASSGLFLNLYSTYTLTSGASWSGNIAGTITSNLYTLFVAPYSVPGGQWNSYGTSALVTSPTANGGIRFNQPGPYMITTVISADSGIKTIALSSNTGNTVDLHSNITNVWQYCYRFPFGDVNPWPVTIPVNVTNTSQYYYLDIETNNQTDNIRQTAYTNVTTLAYTGSYVIIRPI